eukprot:1139524-Pelagomonas_calceolata.AAC.24
MWARGGKGNMPLNEEAAGILPTCEVAHDKPWTSVPRSGAHTHKSLPLPAAVCHARAKYLNALDASCGGMVIGIKNA